MASSITLHSLLETHDQPFCVIDASLKVIAVNRAYEILFGKDRAALIGQHCCWITGESPTDGQCRHSKLFCDLEPYQGIHSVSDEDAHWRSYRVRGFPLMDSDSLIYLGETILPVGGAPGGEGVRISGRSPAFRQLMDRLGMAAGSLVPVLLEGETGTGKEVAAEYIHRHSARRDRQLVVVDCTVLADDLFESELFGHEKGSFTGSAGAKTGLFELADQSTLFLDEIGELPLSLQPKLLRALESGSFRRVGGTEARHADVRVISATHRNLQEMVQEGSFREDLYYRLAVLPIAVPALRERREDIPVIARHLLSQIGPCVGQEFDLTPKALQRLGSHAFPGNIRELRNVLQLAATLTGSRLIDAEHIILGAGRNAPTSPPSSAPTPAQTAAMNPLENMEISYIAELLRKHHGSRRLAAAEMNVSERTLYRKLKRYQLNG